MGFLNLVLSFSALYYQAINRPVTVDQAQSAPEFFFSLRTSVSMIYDGMERFFCDGAACSRVEDIDTPNGIAMLKDGRYLRLGLRSDPVRSNIVGTIEEVSGGKLKQWRRLPGGPPKSSPEIPGYQFVRANQVLATDAYVGLWHRSGNGSGRQAIVVLFDGGKVEGSSFPAACGKYRVLASVDHRIDILEVRPIYHVGHAVNLASYDPGSKAIWLARMILPESALNCR